MTSYYRNEYLFSEIYLQEITQQAEKEDVLASLETIKEYRDWADTSDIQTWKSSFVHEVLYALRFGVKAESDHVTLLYPMGTLDQPISVCYILLPDEDLDNTTMGHNWAEKIIRNLREHDLQWGLLTNGEKWRIYHLDEPTPYETYLEIDLAAILADKASEAFKIFHKFLQAENFILNDNRESRFDLFKKESQAKIDYIEEELANALKQKEEGGQGVLSSLCMGYVEYLRERENPDFDDEDLRHKIYHGAMLYMFRMLFLFYADARELLSKKRHEQIEDIRQKSWGIHHGGAAEGESFQLWTDLEDIFVDIDQTYNGGLFNPYENEFTQFIEEYRVSDLYLVPAIYHMAHYREKSGEDKRISYRDMSVRHLGTLYEGLLEHKLFIALEDTEVRVYKDRIEFVPVSQGGRLIAGRYISSGQVYFGNDSSERKATGSYYTPEPIVNFMVCETVGKKLDDLTILFKNNKSDLLISHANAVSDNEKASIANLIVEEMENFVKENFLNLTILDPAMGSGHFLVNSAKLVSNYITDFLNLFNINNINLETSTSHWRRLVAENCIFGVDLNPLAVELAKLSLWILSMAKNTPLSFLNHHLKQGNSLIGTIIDEVGEFPGNALQKNMQRSFFEKNTKFIADIDSAIEKINRISLLRSSSLDEIIQKREWLNEVDNILQPYKTLCNFHIDASRGNIEELEYYSVIENGFPTSSYEAYSDSYFHWELEFPDILLFSSGFDVIVTNPPYLGESGNRDVFEEVKKGSMRKYYLGKMDLLYFFFHLANDLSKNDGYISLITTNYYITADGAMKLRSDLKARTEVIKLINFNELKIFDSATGQHNMITILKKGIQKDLNAETCITKNTGNASQELLEAILERIDPLTKYNTVTQDEVFDGEKNYIRFTFDDINQKILKKMQDSNFTLGTVCNIYQGVVSGANKVTSRHLSNFQLNAVIGEGIFILSTEELGKLDIRPTDRVFIKPWFKNSDIKRWYTTETSTKYILYFDRETDQIPEIFLNHLQKFRSILENRREVRNGVIEWWQLQWPRTQDIFENPKIVVPMRSYRNTFGINEIPWYAASDVYYLIPKSNDESIKYIISLLNSKAYYYWLYFKGKRKGEN